MGLISRVSSRTYRDKYIMDVKTIFLFAFTVSVGFVFQVVAGVSSGNWVTMVSMVFFLLGVFPGILMLKDGSGPLKEWSCFLAAAFMTSAIAFPLTLAYSSTSVTTTAGWLSAVGNLLL